MHVFIKMFLFSSLIFSCKQKKKEVVVQDPVPQRADFLQLINKIENAVPCLFQTVDSNWLNTIRENTLAQISASTGTIEFFRLAYPVVAGIKDPHFKLALSDDSASVIFEKNKVFPLKLYVGPDELYVKKDYRNVADKIAHGRRILSINHLPAAQIIKALSAGVQYNENEQRFFYSHLERNLNELLLLLLDYKNEFVVELDDGSEYTIEGVFKNDLKEKDTVQNVSYRFLTANHKKAGYLRLASLVIEDDLSAYDNVFQAFFTQVKNENINDIIIDIRDNYGGSTRVIRNLLEYIAREKYVLAKEAFYDKETGKPEVRSDAYIHPSKDKTLFKGKIKLLVNENTFSSGHIFVSVFKYYKMGLIIGEPGIEKTVISGELKKEVFDKAGNELWYPNSNFLLNGYKRNNVQSLLPDYIVRRSVTDRINQADPVLELALGLIAKDK